MVRRIAAINSSDPDAPASVRRLTPVTSTDLVVTSAIGILIGGRLGYVLFYQPELFISFTAEAPWWGVVQMNRGGMASHGGVLGFAAAAAIHAWRRNLRYAYLLDLGAFTAPLGLCFGRIANFINGELFGRACREDFPLAVKFPQEIFTKAWNDDARRALLEQLPPAMQTDIGGHPFDKMMTALWNGDPVIRQLLDSVLTPRYPSQLFQAAMEGLLVFLIGLVFWRKPRKSGVVGSLFVVSYAVMRIIGEQFRLPDEHLGFQWLGLTRGQWLSVVMLLIGVGCMVFFASRPGRPVAGWRKSAA